MERVCDANTKSGFIDPVDLNFQRFYDCFALNVEVLFQSNL